MWATQHVFSARHQQYVSDTTLFLCQAVSLIMSHPWAMTNSMWVTLLYLPSLSHQSCLILWPTESEWHSYISSCQTVSSIAGVSCHDQQQVSDTALFLCQAVLSIMSHPVINREWVMALLYFFARQSHQSCVLQWPTECEWHYFISCQAFSSIMYLPITNRKWVTLLYFFARQSHQSCLILWPTVCEWQCFIFCQAVSSSMSHNREWVTLLYLINYVSPHDQQTVSDTVALSPVSSIMSHPMINRMWVTLLYFQSYQLCFIPWPTGSKWHCFISSIMPHPLGQQTVSDNVLFLIN